MGDTWSAFWRAILWGVGTLLIFFFTTVKKSDDDPADIKYNLLRVAKYGSLMTGSAFLINAIQILVALLR